MNIQARQGKAITKSPQRKRLFDLLCMSACVLFLGFPLVLDAQTPEQVPEQASQAVEESAQAPEEIIVLLPDGQQMALALATPGSRQQTFLDLAAAASVLNRVLGVDEVDAATLAQNYLTDRAWLQMLVDRHGWFRPYSSVLDPAAWLVQAELRQHDLEGMELVAPGRTPEAVLMYQVFQRSQERLAAANLPVLLLEIEAGAITLWDEFLQLAGAPEAHHAAWKEVEDSWFKDRQKLLPRDLGDGSENVVVVENIPLAMSKLVLTTVDELPPDARGLVQLRYSILKNVQELAGTENPYALEQARDSLYLVSLVDGLHEGRYFEFIRGLIAVTSDLLDHPENTQETFSIGDWLVKELPAISAQYAANFAGVDPGLNAAMAAAFEVLQGMTGIQDSEPETGEAGLADSRAILADAVAKLALLIPDMAYYFDTPVRARIIEEINICISIAASRDESGGSAMTRSQFNACMEALLQLADKEIRLAELSGDMNGPFTTETLRRELNIAPWQRINYGIGYLHERHPGTCQAPANALPNPLEWSVLVTTMAWFAEYSPEFFHTPENESRLTKMRSIGEQLILDLAEQSGCLATATPGVDDPVGRGMMEYELALRELEVGIKNAELDFRTPRLRPGADVSLAGDALQKTTYRPDDLVIEPCDAEAVCDMSGTLSTTRALIGLFPDEYLVAEQTGMGHIEICYQNMEWVQRRSELLRADDENVANYFARLGFDLMGRYVENGEVSDIFGFRFTSPDEYHYLFAQTSEDVLNDSCPVEWVGSRVVTPLRENRGGIVPDRLTYLAASRSLPSRLLQNNWAQGAEWRDWFVTGLGVSPLDVPAAPTITTRLNQHLQTLYQAEQSEVFQRVLLPNARNSQGDEVSLFAEMSQLSIAKALIRMHMMLFYPESMFTDTIRMAIAGDAGLLDGRVLRRFREDNVALTSVNTIAHERLNKLRKAWVAQEEAVRRQGSIPPSLMHALTRTNILYRRFFTSRPEPLQEVEVTAKPRQ